MSQTNKEQGWIKDTNMVLKNTGNHAQQENETDERDTLESRQEINEATPDDFIELVLESSEKGDRSMSPAEFLPEGRVHLLLDESCDPKNEESNEIAQKKMVKISEMDPKELILKAAEKGRVDLVEHVLAQDPCLHECTDEDGYTALHRASYEGHIDVVKLLLSKGANVRARTLDGWQPLHSACRWGKVEVASLLLQNGGDIHGQTNGKQTALHLAALGAGGTSTLKLLLCHRWIDTSLTNNQGETAYDIAKRSGRWASLFEMVEESINVK